MSRWRKIVENILLEDKYDLSSFSINDIASFSESCKKASLKENNLDEQIKELVDTFHDYVREGMFKLDEKRGIFDDIVFRRPSSLLPELLQLQNDEIVKAKLDKMREHFKVDKYLNKEEKKGVPVYSLDKRGSFLHFLRFTEEFDNKAKILKKVEFI